MKTGEMRYVLSAIMTCVWLVRGLSDCVKLKQLPRGFDALIRIYDQIHETTDWPSVMENQSWAHMGCGHLHVAAFSGVKPLWQKEQHFVFFIYVLQTFGCHQLLMWPKWLAFNNWWFEATIFNDLIRIITHYMDDLGNYSRATFLISMFFKVKQMKSKMFSNCKPQDELAKYFSAHL